MTMLQDAARYYGESVRLFRENQVDEAITVPNWRWRRIQRRRNTCFIWPIFTGRRKITKKPKASSSQGGQKCSGSPVV